MYAPSVFQAECLVVLIARNLDLEKGFLSNKVLEESGSNLKKEINSKYLKRILKPGELIATLPGRLKKKGVKLLIFGYLPKWKNDREKLQVVYLNYLVDIIHF